MREWSNFGVPATSFDVFSFGVLALQLLQGRAWVQEALNDFDKHLGHKKMKWHLASSALGLGGDLLLRMLDHASPENRPTPAEILTAVATSPDAAVTSTHVQLPTDGKVAAESPVAENGDELDHPTPMLDEAPASRRSSVPETLRVIGARVEVDCNGVYRLVHGETPNGFPLCQRESGMRWLYSSVNGK